MKGKKFLLAGVAILGLGMTSCNNDDVPSVGNPTEGSTFVGMYISTMKDVMTRAVNDSQGDYAGRADESTLESLRLISLGTPRDWTLGSADEENKFWETTRPELTRSPHGKPPRAPKQWRCCLTGALLIPVSQRPRTRSMEVRLPRWPTSRLSPRIKSS